MKKILILEDRVTRQESFLEDSNLSKDFFVRHKDFIDNFEGTLFEDFKEKLANEEEYDFLLEYNCVIVHRSAFKKEIINKIFSFCSKNKINLVYFSGGISSTNLREDSKFSFLTINSKQFYSSNLAMFIDEFRETGNNNLGILAFGERYELNILLSFSHKLSFVNAVKILGEYCLIEEFVERYDVDNEFVRSILKSKFIWFDEDNIDNALKTLEVVNSIKKIIEEIITEKVKFND
ncbi:hypothetical protein [Flavobacterium sp. ABG]|jgi:hypothetical protein|uniref:hypothetical protein n=1 Tax=Flavobacterium sp. ABG TaxID=1423322 RepID=UPI00064A9AD9|nr:hypothetical protein [Flavobacterium sp. ABG]KLT68656.1 hypothetical protein AB674_16645 [Flavobacterium sp. ABG]